MSEHADTMYITFKKIYLPIIIVPYFFIALNFYISKTISKPELRFVRNLNKIG